MEQPPCERVILRSEGFYDFSSDSEDEAKPSAMDTSDDTNRHKSTDTVQLTAGAHPTDTVEPPAKR
jgi:hypothetical protein